MYLVATDFATDGPHRLLKVHRIPKGFGNRFNLLKRSEKRFWAFSTQEIVGRDGSRSKLTYSRSKGNQPESAILAHSHLLVQHLLKQLEHHKRERSSRQRRPEWLSVFVHQVAALFEPFTGVARVGSQCEFTEEGWEARLYLGSTEVVGGKNDGHAHLVSFELDFVRLSQTFTKLNEFRWNVAASPDGGNSSFVALRGLVDDNPVTLKVYSRPPKEAGPAFRQHADGSLNTVGF